MKKSRFRLGMVTSLIIVAALVVGALILYSVENNKRISTQNKRYLKDNTTQVADLVDKAVTDGYSNIRIISNLLSDSLTKPEFDLESIRGILADSVFDFIEFADKDGMDHNITGGVSDARDRQYYIDGMKGNVGMEIIMNSRATHENLFMFYSPVRYNNQIIGSLVGVYQASNRINKMLQVSYYGDEATSYLCDRNGRIVASNLPLDVTKEIYLESITGGNTVLNDKMSQCLQRGSSLSFEIGEQDSLGYMMKLKNSNLFLVQIFPQAVGKGMIDDANTLGLQLVFFLLALYLLVLVVMGKLFKNQQEQEMATRKIRDNARSSAVIAALTDDYDYICHIDMGTQTITRYKCSPGFGKLFPDLATDRSPSPDMLDGMWMSLVPPAEISVLRNEVKKEKVLEVLKKNGTFTHRFLATLPEGSKYYDIKFSQDPNHSRGIIMGLCNVDKIVRDQIELENENRIMTLTDEFESIYDVDIDTGNYSVSTKTGVFTESLMGNLDMYPDYFESNAINIPVAIYEEDREMMLCCMTREYMLMRLAAEPSFSLDYRCIMNKNVVWYRMKVARYGSWPSEHRMLVGLFNNDDNIRREREHQEEMEAARKQAEAASEAKSAFLFNMSHDIRTPMNAITGYTAMAKKYINDPEKVTDCLDKIDVAGENLLGLINQVLDMSRIESGKITIEEAPLDIVERIETITSIVSASAKAKGVALNCMVKDISNRMVLADGARLNQIALNILGNAIKYTPDGGTINFTLTQLPCEEAGRGIYMITTEDTGIGMSEEFLDSIFDAFAREKTSTVSKIEGTGLGMSIVKRLVDLLGGNIEISSKKDEGTRVDVTLTFNLQSEQELNTPETQKFSAEILRGKRVLVVEDNEMNREIAKDILEDKGLIVDEAEDGDIAVEKVKSAEPGFYDFILMDVQMPRMNGYQASRAIRGLENKEMATIPIVAMTANAFEEDKRNAIAAGMDEHLSKPINPELLIQTLSRFIIGN